ncbi:hypothetical protein BDW74DRAFT_160356, partial [Aspergillus multicolor]|uniref:uncharacterized protein n=1 Tax=Aspergillus multicolor TaxID=41759 RepID=UPI003CCCEA46
MVELAFFSNLFFWPTICTDPRLYMILYYTHPSSWMNRSFFFLLFWPLYPITVYFLHLFPSHYQFVIPSYQAGSLAMLHIHQF